MKNSTKIALLYLLIIAGIFSIPPNAKQTRNNDIANVSAPMKNKKLSNKNIKILFAGDLMFDRHIREVAQKEGNDFILRDIKSILAENDLVVVNLESPLTTFPSRSAGTIPGSPENYIFTADPSVARTLYDNNIRLVNLGNNHILNFGKVGLDQTKNYLTVNNVKYFGSDDKTYEIIDFDGYTIGFVAYNQFSAGSKDRALQAVKRVSEETDMVILYAHWGSEYITISEKTVQTLAHEFIDNGVDLIIGSHPHVVQQTEVYKNKTIYYSLGNFVMDQYFEDNVKNGLMVVLNINPTSEIQSLDEIKVEIQTSGQTTLKR